MSLLIKTLDEKDFLQGESTYDWVANKGFSPSSYQVNPFKKPGVLYFQPDQTDRGANITDNLLAYTFDKNFLGNDLYVLGDGGCFYTVNGATVTKRQTAAADTFTLGTSDLIQFQGNTFATSATRVMLLTGSDLATLDSGWWTGLTTSYRHPMEIVEDKLYIGDVNLIYSWDGTTSTTAITLPPDVNVTSLRKHPDGRHLIAFCGMTANFSHTRPGPGKIYVINKDTLKWEREILIDAQVEGSRVVGGVVYVTYGQKLGYFTGSGIEYIKTLKTSTTTYSHSMGNMEDVLLIRDGQEVLAFADFGRGKGWFRIYKNSVASNLRIVAHKGASTIMVGDGSDNLFEVDYTAAGGTSGGFYINRQDYGSKAKIRRIEYIHDKKASGSVLIFNAYYVDADDSSSQIQNVNHPSSPTVAKTRIDTDIETDTFQLLTTPSNGVLGIKKIRIYYEPIP